MSVPDIHLDYTLYSPLSLVLLHSSPTAMVTINTTSRPVSQSDSIPAVTVALHVHKPAYEKKTTTT